MLYKSEKILRFANLNEKIAYIEVKQPGNWGINPPPGPIQPESGIIYDTNCYLDFLNFIYSERKRKSKIIYTNKEEVEKEYSENGLIFTEEELKNIKFSRLMDDDFVLNRHNKI